MEEVQTVPVIDSANQQALGSLQNLENMGGPFRGLLDSFALATSEWRSWFQTDAPQVQAAYTHFSVVL